MVVKKNPSLVISLQRIFMFVTLVDPAAF